MLKHNYVKEKIMVAKSTDIELDLENRLITDVISDLQDLVSEYGDKAILDTYNQGYDRDEYLVIISREETKEEWLERLNSILDEAYNEYKDRQEDEEAILFKIKAQNEKVKLEQRKLDILLGEKNE